MRCHASAGIAPSGKASQHGKSCSELSPNPEFQTAALPRLITSLGVTLLHARRKNKSAVGRTPLKAQGLRYVHPQRPHRPPLDHS